MQHVLYFYTSPLNFIIKHVPLSKMKLCLDVGIKNLAYCMGDDRVRAWKLVNLTNLEDTVQLCVSCGKPAKAMTPTGLVCGRHVNVPWIVDKNTHTPTVKQLVAFLETHHIKARGKREVLLTQAMMHGAVPLKKTKKIMSFAANTVDLHDAIRDWITRDWSELALATSVHIEHQPVYKNPAMKTVQLLLFASLRDRFLAHQLTPTFHFVHAGKKVDIKGEDAYAERKKGGIVRATDYLSEHEPDWMDVLASHSKKDDLCDALCMWLDLSPPH